MGNLESLFFYLSLFGISALLFHVGNRLNYKYYPSFLAIFPLVFIAGIRFGVGTDYFTYLSRIEKIAELSVQEIFTGNFFESGFLLLERGANVFGHQLFFGFVALLTLFPLILALKQYSVKIAGLCFFLYLILYFTYSLNLMRQLLAVSIVFWGFQFIFKKQLIKFLMTLLLASLFHITALLIAPIYFLWSPKQKVFMGRAILMALSLVIITLNFQPFILWMAQFSNFERFSYYAISNPIGQNRELILNIGILILVYLHRKVLIKLDSRYEFFILLLVMAILINTTGNIIPYVKRMSFYFDIGQILLLAAIPLTYEKDKDRYLMSWLLFFYGISYFILVFFILGHAHIIPYRI